MRLFVERRLRGRPTRLRPGGHATGRDRHSARAATAGSASTQSRARPATSPSPTLVSPSVQHPSSRHRTRTPRPVLEQREFHGRAGAYPRRSRRSTWEPAQMTLRRHREIAGGPGRRGGPDTHADRIRVCTDLTLSKPASARSTSPGQTFRPAYREATQFVTGPSYVLRRRCGSPRVPVPVRSTTPAGMWCSRRSGPFGLADSLAVEHPGRRVGGPRG